MNDMNAYGHIVVPNQEVTLLVGMDWQTLQLPRWPSMLPAVVVLARTELKREVLVALKKKLFRYFLVFLLIGGGFIGG